MNSRQNKADQIAQSRALTKQQTQVVAPVIEQPAYLVPEADAQLHAGQTASWDTSEEIKILRYYLAKCAQDGGSATLIVQLTRAIDTMIARNQSTALKCGHYLSREAIRDYILVIQQIAAESIRSRVPLELFEEIVDDMRQRLNPYFSPDAIAQANERHE